MRTGRVEIRVLVSSLGRSGSGRKEARTEETSVHGASLAERTGMMGEVLEDSLEGVMASRLKSPRC